MLIRLTLVALWVSGPGSREVTAQPTTGNSPATNAGFYTRINQKGLDLLADYLRERVVKFMSNGEITYNLTADLTKDVRFSLLSLKILRFDEAAFGSRINPVPNKGVVWTGSNLNVTVESLFKVNHANGEIMGNVPLSFDKTNVELLLWTGVNGDGHLKTDLVTCKVAANDVVLKFSSTDALLLNAYLSLITTFIRERIEQAICPTFHAELVPVISNRLLNTPMSAALFDQYFVNYGLLGPVSFENRSIVLRHRGNAFGILRQGKTRLNDFRLPFRAPSLNIDGAVSDKMVDFYLSNYTLVSLLFWMDQYRKFDFEISPTAVNNSAIAGYLRTDCGDDDICAGTLFPGLKTRFPNGVVIIKSHTISYPHLYLTPGKAQVDVDSRIDAFVQQGDKNRRFLTATMNAQLTLEKPTYNDYVFNAQLRIEKFKIREVASLVEGIDETSLEFLVNALNDLILSDDIAQKLKGVKMPIMFDFEQKTSEVVFEKDRMRLSADYCFGSRCQNGVVEQKNTENSDYYDTIG